MKQYHYFLFYYNKPDFNKDKYIDEYVIKYLKNATLRNKNTNVVLIETKNKQNEICNNYFHLLRINKSINEYWDEIVHVSYAMSSKYSNEPIKMSNSEREDIISALKLRCYSFEINEEIKNKDIFSFISYLSLTLLTSHRLDNGNKRFAFAFITLLMFLSGYQIKWSDNKTKYQSEIIEDWVKLCQNKNGKKSKTDIEIVIWIQEYLKKNAILLL